MSTPDSSIGPGTKLRYLRSGDRKIVVVKERKADNSGWSLKDGGGLFDAALNDWEIVTRDQVAADIPGDRIADATRELSALRAVADAALHVRNAETMDDRGAWLAVLDVALDALGSEQS